MGWCFLNPDKPVNCSTDLKSDVNGYLMNRMTFPGDSSVPLLTAFVASVGMTAGYPVTPSGATAKSRGLVFIQVVV